MPRAWPLSRAAGGCHTRVSYQQRSSSAQQPSCRERPGPPGTAGTGPAGSRLLSNMHRESRGVHRAHAGTPLRCVHSCKSRRRYHTTAARRAAADTPNPIVPLFPQSLQAPWLYLDTAGLAAQGTRVGATAGSASLPVTVLATEDVCAALSSDCKSSHGRRRIGGSLEQHGNSLKQAQIKQAPGLGRMYEPSCCCFHSCCSSRFLDLPAPSVQQRAPVRPARTIILMAALCEGPGISTGHGVLELLRLITITIERSIHQVMTIFLPALPRRARMCYWAGCALTAC